MEVFLSPAWPRRLRSQLANPKGLSTLARHRLGTEARMATRVIFDRLLYIVWSMYFPKILPSSNQDTESANHATHVFYTSFRATSVGQSSGIWRVSYPSKRAMQLIATYPAAASMLIHPSNSDFSNHGLIYLHWTSFTNRVCWIGKF